jgi:hypothetical protein
MLNPHFAFISSNCCTSGFLFVRISKRFATFDGEGESPESHVDSRRVVVVEQRRLCRGFGVHDVDEPSVALETPDFVDIDLVIMFAVVNHFEKLYIGGIKVGVGHIH